MSLLSRIGGMRPETVGYKIFKRAHRLLEVPETWLELKSAGISTPIGMSHYGRSVIAELKQCLKSGDDLVVFDVGAYTGDFATALAKLRAVKKIVSFEPVPALFRSLEKKRRMSPKSYL